MIYRLFVILSLLCILASPGLAAEQRGDLVLYKEPMYEFEDPIKIVCISLFDVDFGKDVPDMRVFRDYLCQGRYTLTVAGEKGRVVTLFGDFQYRKDWGFMIIRKLDDQKVWLDDIEDIPSGKWVRRKASHNSGAVEIFFYEQPQFSQRISSVKWGQWWKGTSPID